MRTKLIVGVGIVAAALLVAGTAWSGTLASLFDRSTSEQSMTVVSTSDCCAMQKSCCDTFESCCSAAAPVVAKTDCCPAGACCPGEACCGEAKTVAKNAAACCPDGDCCPLGACCVAAVKQKATPVCCPPCALCP